MQAYKTFVSSVKHVEADRLLYFCKLVSLYFAFSLPLHLVSLSFTLEFILRLVKLCQSVLQTICVKFFDIPFSLQFTRSRKREKEGKEFFGQSPIQEDSGTLSCASVFIASATAIKPTISTAASNSITTISCFLPFSHPLALCRLC